MDENHQDKTESKLIVTEDVKWGTNRKSKLWVPKHKKRTGFEGKTLWDKLNLFGTLAIPLIIALATIGFGLLQVHLADLQHQSDQKLAQQQHDTDQQQALDQQRATILQTYIDNIQDLLLNHHLLEANGWDPSSRYYDVAELARARTLTALQGLDPHRQGRLVQFLKEAGLIVVQGKLHVSIVKLLGANLAGIDLERADLGEVFLAFVDLRDANLNGAELNDPELVGAYLAGADLVGAYLAGADLVGAYLAGADLRDAYLAGADLRGAGLQGANLQGARNLTQQQLDQVYTCKDAILSKGLTCNNDLSIKITPFPHDH